MHPTTVRVLKPVEALRWSGNEKPAAEENTLTEINPDRLPAMTAAKGVSSKH